jgi:hypothetical protein
MSCAWNVRRVILCLSTGFQGSFHAFQGLAALQELWALIMDAGTAYTAQCYNLTGQFLPKEWIMEKWEEGFYITAMAGSNSGWSLVAMSKGTPYTQQSYKVAFASTSYLRWRWAHSEVPAGRVSHEKLFICGRFGRDSLIILAWCYRPSPNKHGPALR